ncbi:rhodanese-like domain-containing protein [Deinococcus deserti]|uniref:Putative rhodanese domain protein n=1 Tax=Deinococcus deserti (strain DSM 17065 / CIP 109153 / LMG 22923 / VCD115) TaxID=546414 RepID=C1D274_DEIDV|nr:rhodanese-like domain-containing protein [Deinococcus deserti]ACO47513.2 putative rhodanese domain protein [Deinococcus deserti VCD115]
MKRLTPKELNTLNSSRKAPVTVDVRSSEEFEAGHVDGALNIPITDLPQRLGELPKDRPVVTYCNMFHPGASRGEKAAAQLLELGFDAGVLEGGYPAWKDAGAADPAPENK